jgi:3-deoxy-7-phosphoheptulonate synthase
MGVAYRLASREARSSTTVIHVGATAIGASELVLIAGPCSVESREQMMAAAQAVRTAGGGLLRGGAYKPRTSPYGFQGLGEKGLELLAEAGAAVGLPVVTEVLEPSLVDVVSSYADVLQIGSRNMANTPLLRAVGRARRPVMLKRGMASTVDEWLLAAEYVLAEGNEQVVLCERGVRGFEPHLRNLLDPAVVALLRTLTHLPVIVDPSHATGRRDLVAPAACAAIAAGADGVMIEVHPNPASALTDGPQAVPCDELPALAARLRAVARAVRAEALAHSI